MSSYQIFCDSCESEYSVTPYEDGAKLPAHCCYCGSKIDEASIREESSEMESVDDEWERLSNEALDEIDDWKIE